MEKKYMTTKEAASYLGISVSAMQEYAAKGTIKYTKPNGKLLYFLVKDLDEWVENAQEEQREES